MKNEVNFTIRPLFSYDKPAVEELEAAWKEEEGFFSGLSEMMPADARDDEFTNMENAYGYGLFIDDVLVSMCSMGYADGVCSLEVKYDDVLLSDVFTRKEYRGNGYASILVKKVVEVYQETSIFLSIMSDDLAGFYNQFGFEMLDAEYGLMKREKTSRAA